MTYQVEVRTADDQPQTWTVTASQDGIAAARQNPGGWLYDIDPLFDPDGEVPPYGVAGGWRVDDAGRITDEFEANPAYRPSPTALRFPTPPTLSTAPFNSRSPGTRMNSRRSTRSSVTMCSSPPAATSRRFGCTDSKRRTSPLPLPTRHTSRTLGSPAATAGATSPAPVDV